MNGNQVTPYGPLTVWYQDQSGTGILPMGEGSSITLPRAGNSNAVFQQGQNEVTVYIYGPPCAYRSVYSLSTKVNVSGFGDFRQNPITIDPTTGRANAYIDGSTPDVQYSWGTPSSNALTLISPYRDPNGGGSSSYSNSNQAIYGSNYSASPCGLNYTSYINVGMYSPTCGYTSKQLLINPTAFTAVVSPSFSTGCAGTNMPLTVTRSGGKAPYGAGNWGVYDPSKANWLKNPLPESATINSGGTAGSVTVFYTSTDANNCPTTGWAGATVNLTSGSGGASTGWGSGQLVNTACAQNLGVLSNSFSNFWLNNQVVNFIGTDKRLHFYFFEPNSTNCNGNSAWMLDTYGIPGIPTNWDLSSSSNAPRIGTPLWSNIVDNNYVAFYLTSNRLVRINSSGTLTQSSNTLDPFNNPNNFCIVGKRLYLVDNGTIKVINDITTPIITITTLFANVTNITGTRLVVVGNYAYYAKGNPSVLTRLDLTSGVESIPNANYFIDNESDLAIATNEAIFSGGSTFPANPNGMIAFTSNNFSKINYYNTSNGSITTITNLPVPANGRIAPVNGSSISSIFFEGNNGNIYQAGQFSNGIWSIKKATDANISDQATGHIAFNSSNVLYLTNSVGNSLVYNLYPTGCGSTIRKEAINRTIDSTQHRFHFYPNPFSGNVQIDLETRNEEQVSIEIFNTTGIKAAILKEAFPRIGPRTVQWETGSSFPKGVYLARVIVQGKTVYSQKLVAE